MGRFTDPLASVKVASPCPASWDNMIGSERVRFCSQCQLNVYNLSAMSRDAAEALIMNSEGRLCVRFYRRRDGSILTEDCPVGLRKLKRRASRIRRAVMSAVLGFFAGAGGTVAVNQVEKLFGVSRPGWGETVGVMADPEERRVNASPEMGQIIKASAGQIPTRRRRAAR